MIKMFLLMFLAGCMVVTAGLYGIDREMARQDYLKGNCNLLDICRKYKIHSDRQLRNWIKVYNAHGDFGFVKESGGGSYMM